MDYCPECDSILYPKKKDGAKFLVCRSCGYERPLAGEDVSTFKLTKKIDHTLDKTLVKDEKYYDELYGESASKECPRCGGRMIMKSQQTRSADEGITHFFICLKCNKQIRLYS